MKETLPKSILIALRIAFYVLLVNTLAFTFLCSANPGWHTVILDIFRFSSGFATGWLLSELWKDRGLRYYNKRFLIHLEKDFPGEEFEDFREFTKKIFFK